MPIARNDFVGLPVKAIDALNSGLGRLSDLQSARKMQYFALAFSLLLALLLATFEADGPVERTFHNIRDSINAKPASGKVHLLEIDAKSIAELQSWPWPRRYHAELVDQLNKAGVAQIVFDVDFSSRSSKSEDEAFARAIARAEGKVVLPTFRQAESVGNGDVVIESVPIDIFAQNAFLGSVNVRPDRSGQVNVYPYGTVTSGKARPSIAALLADSGGALDTDFKIDQSIEIDTIPRHSFADIIAGRFDKTALKGQKVLIGATAIEMGDRYATNRFGVIPGVVIQAMAAETLLADMDLPDLGAWPMFFFVLTTIAFSILRFSGRELALGVSVGAIVIALFAIPILAGRYKIAHLDVFPALALAALFTLTQYFLGMMRKLSVERRLDKETGLPNLMSWQTQIGTDKISTIVVADVQNFEEILSTLTVGDATKFIHAVTNRIELITGDQQIYRIGRELLCWEMDKQELEEIEERLDGAGHLFNSPLNIGGRLIRATICFGVARGSMNDPAALANNAALAAKKAGAMGLRSIWHDNDLSLNTDQSLFILSEFEEALVTGQISVVYQPKYSLRKKKVTGAEALVRWYHPEKGAISPAIFVPILEQENLMEALTLFVLRRVTEEMTKWNSIGGPLGCAINISGSLLIGSDFAERATSLIQSSEIDPKLLTMELTETAVLSSPEQAAETLEGFKALGIRLSIDDYGTGQSTLSYLRKFEADEIKIDQSFVRMIATDSANRIMVRSTIEMAKALGASVVAEGVEDEETRDLLIKLGCDTIQGWLISKPVPSAQFIQNWCKPDSSDANPVKRKVG